MVSVKLMGGLGNMLFQIAFIEDLASRGDLEVRYPDIDESFQKLLLSGHSGNCFDYLNIFKNFDWKKNQDKPMPNRLVRIPFHYEHIAPVDNMIYYGYFQSEKYFNREETLKLFEPAELIREKIPLKTMKGVTSIHVRRGDFLDPKDVQFNQGMDYYNKAMDMFKGDFMIFSDDYKWCKERFKGDNIDFYEDFKEPVDYIEMYWMSLCENNIIANSSFSWWGAYLNQNPNKKVIAPAKWFKPESTLSARDIYTSNMIII